MAKRKRSTALFEVISKSRQYRPASPATARSGNWFSNAATWFVRPKFQPAGIDTQPKRALAAQEMEYEEAPVAVAAQVAEFEEPVAVAPPPPAEIVKYEAPARPINQEVPVRQHDPETNLHVTMDSDRRQIALKMSYAAAAVAGLGLVTIVCLSVMLGQHFGRGNLPILAQTTTDDLRKGPAHREILDPPRRTGTSANRPAASDTKTTARIATPAGSELHANSQIPDSKRYINHNYVVIQSYPASKQDMADKTAAFLNNHGVSCTVETKVKGFLEYSVVGLDGFPKISVPEYTSYVEHIRKLSSEYAGNSRSIKAFEPIAKKWDKQD